MISVPKRHLLILFLGSAALVSGGTVEAASYKIAHAFDTPTTVRAGVIQGPDGALYGTTEWGGSFGIGGVFKLSADGTSLAMVHSFDDTDIANPYGGVIRASDGAYYGTSPYGGASGYGAVYRVARDGSLSIVHSFDYHNEGGRPFGDLIQGRDGGLYGTTSIGGPAAFNGFGTVFRLSLDGSSFTVLHGFDGFTDGGTLKAGVVEGSDGNIYGTTGQDGTYHGRVYRVSADGSSFATIHGFDSTNGGAPVGRLVQASDGSLYGATSYGGASNLGVVFKVSVDGSSFSVLHSFDGTDGATPAAGLLLGLDGDLYGTTSQGGASGAGTVFKCSPDGLSVPIIHHFDGANGAAPSAELIQSPDGTLYGTTLRSSASSIGTVFKLSPDGSSFSVLRAFGASGSHPSWVIQNADGTIFGTTPSGGTFDQGTVFRISTDGAFSVLRHFDFPNGSPARILQTADGTLYGTARGGGIDNGAVFKMSPDGLSFSILHSFDGTDGSHPNSLIEGSDGAFYGTTRDGGIGGSQLGGVVFKILPDGSFALLYSFTGPDGSQPAGLAQGPDGALYGVTAAGGSSFAGTAFRLTADGSSFSTLHTFSGADGRLPNLLINGSNGSLYGTANSGGAYGGGTVFQLAPNGSSFALLHSFMDAEGPNPGGLVQASDGRLYGTAWGGSVSHGTVFKVSPTSGFFAVVRSFDQLGGIRPSGLSVGKDGAFYGMTEWGGTGGGGVVFSLGTPSTIQFAKPVFSATEPGAMAVVTVTRKGSATGVATIDYTTSDGTAIAGVDYVAKTGTLSFAPGIVSRSFSVPLLSGAGYDGDESFLVALSNPQGVVTLGPQRTAVVAIKDRTPVPTLQFGAASLTVSEGVPQLKLTVLRSGLTSASVSVSYATQDGTAQAPGDYATTTGTLSFGAGVVSQTLSVAIVDDAIPEPKEAFGVSLSSASPGAILGARASASVTILDNDQAVQFRSGGFSVSESSVSAIVTVIRKGGTAGTVTVDYSTGAGTATAGTDYGAVSATLTFGPGVATRTFAVPILDDALGEGSETVPLILSNANPPGLLGPLSVATLTILDSEPVVQFSAATYTAGETAEGGRHTSVITVRRSNGTAGTAHVNFATSPGTASPGWDYTETSGQLTFGPGVVSQTFAVETFGNAVDASNPTVNLSLTQVDIPLGSPNSAVLTIRDNDVAGQAQLASAAFSGLASTGSVTVTVKRTGGVAGLASIQYATSDGTAVAGTDYTATSGTITFAAGETTQQIVILVVATGPGNKYFTIGLGPTSGGLSLGPVSDAVVWIVE